MRVDWRGREQHICACLQRGPRRNPLANNSPPATTKILRGRRTILFHLVDLLYDNP